MKFCPYCGASLLGGAVSFCGECGKQIPSEGSAPAPKVPPKLRHEQKKRPAPLPKRNQLSRMPPKPTPKSPPGRRKDPMDLSYDGYYNDVQPIDAGQQGEGVDPELIKKVVLLLLGAVLVIVLATTLMTLL